MRGLLTVMAMSAAVVQAAAGQEFTLPEKLRNVPRDAWVQLIKGGIGPRTSPALLWVPAEKCFILLGGAMRMWGKHNSPYTEMTLNLARCRWENRFPKGKRKSR